MIKVSRRGCFRSAVLEDMVERRTPEGFREGPVEMRSSKAGR